MGGVMIFLDAFDYGRDDHGRYTIEVRSINAQGIRVRKQHRNVSGRAWKRLRMKIHYVPLSYGWYKNPVLAEKGLV